MAEQSLLAFEFVAGMDPGSASRFARLGREALDKRHRPLILDRKSQTKVRALKAGERDAQETCAGSW